MAACFCRISKVMRIPCFLGRLLGQKRDKRDVPGWRSESWRLASFSSPPKFGGSSGTTEGGAAVDSRLFSSIASNFPLPQLTAPPADGLRDTVVLVPAQSPRFLKQIAYPCLHCRLYSSHFSPLPLFAPLNPSFREFCPQ